MTSSATVLKPTRTPIKKGRRRLGEIIQFPTGRSCFLTERKVGDIHRGEAKTIAEAIKAETAAWALNDEAILMLRLQKIDFVAVDCKDTGDRYVTKAEYFYDRERVRMVTTRACAVLSVLPFRFFKRQPGRAKIK
jgi:hypothetical protein